MTPRIGLPTYVERALWGAWDRKAALLPSSYHEAVLAAGGLPLLLPPAPPAEASAVVDVLDGLLLTGGADIGPERYGAEAEPATAGIRPDRDAWDLALLELALERDLPVLAICRGAQVLNVALGGTLHQHVPDVTGTDAHRPEPGVYGTNPVRIAPGSLLASLLGEDGKVLCHHHQAIASLGRGLAAVATTDDGMVEAVELPGRRFVVGIQGHPEDGDDPTVFRAFLQAASGH